MTRGFVTRVEERSQEQRIHLTDVGMGEVVVVVVVWEQGGGGCHLKL